jgi:hypothetical protein
MMKHSMTFEGRHKTRDGRIIPFEINSNYFEFDNQSYSMALVRDISERSLTLKHNCYLDQICADCGQILEARLYVEMILP